MLIQKYPSLRPKSIVGNIVEFGKGFKNPPWVRPPSDADKACAVRMNITPEEAVRRDDIVHSLYMKCSFKAGDVLMAKNVDNRKEYGRLTIRGIFKKYADFHVNEKWPDDDVPYIVSATSEHKGPIICTADFFTKGNHGGTC